jgi:hypothetical protein
MSKTLGVFVSSDKHLDKLIRLCRAAQKKDVEVTIFFSHLGTLLTQDIRFKEFEGLAKMSLCNVSFENHGLQRQLTHMGSDDFATQERHAELIAHCDRYFVF